MPGYVIHLAIGKKFLENNKITNHAAFFKGVIAPDLLSKKDPDSHYGKYSSCPNLKRFIDENDMQSSYNKGYFLHLATDHIFYNKFLTEWSPEIYSDYDKLNEALIKKYNLDIPDEIKEKVKIKEGTPEIIDIEGITRFIDTVGSMDFSKYMQEIEIEKS